MEISQPEINQGQPPEPVADSLSTEDFLNLLSEFAHTKISLNTLILRPVWRDAMQARLQQLGIPHLEMGREQFGHWIPAFYRLGQALQAAETLPMGSVAEIVGVPVSTATRFAEGLVSRDLLERRAAPQDRRVVRVMLTPKGQQALTLIDQAIRQQISEILAHFSPDEQRQLLMLGRKLHGLWLASLVQNPKSEDNSL